MALSVRMTGHEDLNALYERAHRAAAKGDSWVLERELRALRRLKLTGSATVATTLRAVARCARAHPASNPS
jgi:hypothetical protein